MPTAAPFFPPGPQCPLPFNVADVAGGAILCEHTSGPGTAAGQQCQLRCGRGYRSAFPPEPLLCSLQKRRWESQPPHPHACQREWPQEGPPESQGSGPRPLFSPLEGSVSMISQVASEQDRMLNAAFSSRTIGSDVLPRPLGRSFIRGFSGAICSLRHLLLFLAPMRSPGYRTVPTV